MSSIYIPTYDPQDFVPRGIVNLVEGKGLPSVADTPRRVCLIGVSSRSENVNKPLRILAERPEDEGQSAVEYFGAGSELHLMCRAAFKAYPGVELWAVGMEELDGGYSRATAGLTVTGTARRVGEWTVVLHGEPVKVRIEGGQDASSTLESVAEVLRARDDLPLDWPAGDPPITVSGTSATLELSAKHRGVNGNLIDLFRRGGVAGQSMSVSAFQGGTGEYDLGSTSPTPSGPLGAIATKQFHYIVASNNVQDGSGDGNLRKLRDHVELLADPIDGLRQQALYGAVESLDVAVNASEGGTGDVNSPRVQCVWCKGSSLMPGELAAAVAAHRAWMEGSSAAANTAGQVVVGLPRPRLPTDLPDYATLNQALHAGLTPLEVRGTDMSIVRSVTTRYKLPGGGESYELLDTIKVTVSDFLADDIALKMQARFGGFKVAPDTDVPLPSRTATPGTIRKSIIEWLRQYQARGLIHRVDEHLDDVRVQLSEVAPGRVDFEIPEAVVDVCAVTAGNLIQF